MSESFRDQYKNPAWQKKRLEALDAAGFACQCCYDDQAALHVHHKRYVKGRKIWQYENSELSVLCEECHAQEHMAKDAINEIFAALHPMGGLGDIAALLGGYCSSVRGPCFIEGLDLDEYKEFSIVAFVAGALAGKESDSIAAALVEQRHKAIGGQNGKD